MSSSEFAEQMLDLARNAPPFQPTATYDADGDCIEFIASPDSFYAERIDDLVTVYYSHDTNEIVGSLIKCVSRFYKNVVEKVPGFKIEIQDGRIRLVHIFLAKLWTTQPDADGLITMTYKKLIEVAERANVEAPVMVN
jgi:hypothetical protein